MSWFLKRIDFYFIFQTAHFRILILMKETVYTFVYCQRLECNESLTKGYWYSQTSPWKEVFWFPKKIGFYFIFQTAHFKIFITMKRIIVYTFVYLSKTEMSLWQKGIDILKHLPKRECLDSLKRLVFISYSKQRISGYL